MSEYGSWEEWSASDYLNEYYTEVEPDERYCIEFLVDTMRAWRSGGGRRIGRVLDFGCGPTVHRLFPIAPFVSQIHVADYLPQNRAAVQAWIDRAPGAFDWTPFARETLQVEAGEDQPVAADAVDRRIELTRSLITQVLPADASRDRPLGDGIPGYSLVTTHYCADSATDDRDVWWTYMRNIAALVRPGGRFIVSALGGSTHYQVGPRRYPAVCLHAQDVEAMVLALGFSDAFVSERPVPDRADQGYSSVIFAWARR